MTIKLKPFIAIALFVSLTLAFASDNYLEKPAGKINCNQKVQRCLYVTQNITAQDLISKINAIMFPPGTILSPKDGYRHARSLKEVEFWFTGGEGSDFHQRFIALIPLVDTFEEFNPSAVVQFTTEIFSISDEGLSDFNASVQSVLGEKPTTTIGTEGLDIAVSLGTKFLSALIGVQRTKRTVSRVTKVTQLLPNLSNIQYSHTTKIYVSPNSVTTKEETAGVQIGGQVSISREHPEQVMVKNYGLTYGIHNAPKYEGDTSSVTNLSVSHPEVPLTDGFSHVMVSTHTIESTKHSGIDNNGVGGGKSQSQSKLMIIVRARALSYEQLLEESKALSNVSLNQEFSKEDKATLPQSGATLDEVFNSVQTFARYTASGDRILVLKLDKDLATLDNIKKRVTVKITGGGISQKDTRSVENLMLSGLRLDDITASYLDKDVVKLKVRFMPFVNGKNPWEGRVKKKLYYVPETNEFIQ